MDQLGAADVTCGPFSASTPDQLRCEPSKCDAVLVRTMPPGTLEQVVFRMDLLARLAALGCTVINPPRAMETAVDKYLASALLHEAGLPIPATFACQTVDQAMLAFQRLGSDVVVKPLFGGEGRGITRITDENLALRAFQLLTQIGSVIYLQRFIDHSGFDIRALVLGDQVFGMRRQNPDDWRTNVSRGASTEPFELDERLRDVAFTAARAVGAPLAGVDILPGRDGVDYVLEVNAVPGWRALSRTLNQDIAALVLNYLEAASGESFQLANQTIQGK